MRAPRSFHYWVRADRVLQSMPPASAWAKTPIISAFIRHVMDFVMAGMS